ncbi:TPA: DUF5677 domain-containing protein [Vibrio cholerae]
MNHLKNFRKFRGFGNKTNLTSVQTAVECTYEAVDIYQKFMSAFQASDDSTHFMFNAHVNLIGRVQEHLEGMLVCLAAKSPTSSEALGRIVIEGSINLMFMAYRGDEKTIIAFFLSWLNEHERKLDEWQSKLSGKEYEELATHRIEGRRELVKTFRDFVSHGVDKFEVDENKLHEYWPKSLFKRFESLDMVESYYENYHRLSGASHITAEDTISWLFTLGATMEQKIAVAEEAVAYSTMMARFSCGFFIDAIAYSCLRFEFDDKESIQRLFELKATIQRNAMDIAKEAGVPQ